MAGAGAQGTTGTGPSAGPRPAGWHPAEVVVVALATLFGAVLRWQGIGEGLWYDEAYWAESLVHDEHLGDPKRPIGFTLLSRAVTLLGTTEIHLRLVPFLASVAMIPLAWVVARRLFGGRWRALPLLVVVTTAITFIDFAKEFKPYILDAALHLGLAAAVLEYVERPSRGRLRLLCLGVAFCTPFATSTVFALPGVVLLGLHRARREEGGRHARALLGAAAFAAACVAVLWLWSWSRSAGPPSRWGERYGVFPVDEPYLLWLAKRLARTVDIAFATPHPLDWPAVEEVVRWVQRGALAAGLFLAVGRRAWRVLAIAVLPIALAWAFNLFGKWPFGPFRTNQFLLAYVQLLALYPLAWLLGLLPGGRARPVAAVALAGLLLAWRLPPYPGYYRTKGHMGWGGEAARTGNVRRAMEVIHEVERKRPRDASQGPVPIVCDPWAQGRSFYFEVHRGFAERHAEYFARNHVWISSTWEDHALLPVVERTLAEHETFWVLSSWGDAEERERIAEALDLSYDVVVEFPTGYLARVSR